MEQQRIYIPTLNDEPSDFRRLFEIWQQAGEYHWDVRFDFTNCRFLRPNAVAFLGGLARLIESHLGNVVFDWKSVHDEDVMKNICRNGFAGHFGYPESLYTGNSIPYREDKNCDMAGIMDYLERYWLGRGLGQREYSIA